MNRFPLPFNDPEPEIEICANDNCRQEAEGLRYKHDPTGKEFCSRDCLVDWLLDTGEVTLEAS